MSRTKGQKWSMMPGWLMGNNSLSSRERVVVATICSRTSWAGKAMPARLEDMVNGMGEPSSNYRDPAVFTVHQRCLGSLCNEGWVIRDIDGNYLPGVRIMDGFEKGMWDDRMIRAALQAEATWDTLIGAPAATAETGT